MLLEHLALVMVYIYLSFYSSVAFFFCCCLNSSVPEISLCLIWLLLNPTIYHRCVGDPSAIRILFTVYFLYYTVSILLYIIPPQLGMCLICFLLLSPQVRWWIQHILCLFELFRFVFRFKWLRLWQLWWLRWLILIFIRLLIIVILRLRLLRFRLILWILFLLWLWRQRRWRQIE